MATILFNAAGPKLVGRSPGTGLQLGSELSVSLAPASSTSGGTASTTVSHDVTYATANGGGTVSYSNLVIAPSSLGSGVAAITNNAPGVATVSASGAVTPVASGIADVTVTSGPSVSRVQFPVTTTVQNALNGVSGLAPTTAATPNLRYHIWSQITAACALAGGSGPSVQEYYSDAAGTVNANLFIKRSLGSWTPPAGFGSAVTYVPITDANLAPLITGGNLVPITPKHWLCASHCAGVLGGSRQDAAFVGGVAQTQVAKGTAITDYLGNSKGTAQYTVVAVAGANDLCVVYRDTGTNASVVQVMPSTWQTQVPLVAVATTVPGFVGDAAQNAPLPVWIARHHRSQANDYAYNNQFLVNAGAIPTYITPAASIQPYDLTILSAVHYSTVPAGKYPSDSNRTAMTTGPIYPGDSGSSIFVPVNGVPVLLGVVSFAGEYGDLVPALITQINAACAAATALAGQSADGYTVTQASLAGFAAP